jgi:uncharacterized membrane protein YfcA
MTDGGLLLLGVIGFVVGGVGALTGIGGGVVLVPLVALYYGLPMHEAVGVSLVSVIATSTATSALYVEQRITDIRLGMTLELATTLGAFLAALLAHHIDRRTLALMFACFLSYSAFSMTGKAWRSRKREEEEPLTGYTIRNYPLGMAASLLAGGFSGLLGIGGGPIKVPVMHHFMKVPLRVATATSNFMIGVTAATSALVYWGHGDIKTSVAAPLVAGVFSGSLLAARIKHRVHTFYILILLIAVTGWFAAQMFYKVATGGFR